MSYAYFTQVNSTTKLKPFELLLSRLPPTLPIELELNNLDEEQTLAQFHPHWRNELRQRAEKAAANMAKAQAR